MPNIICRNYQHYNRAMGKWIRSKAHYEEEMKRGGYMSEEKSQQALEAFNKKKMKKTELSDHARGVISAAKNLTDKKGNVRMTGQLRKAMAQTGKLKATNKADLDKLPSIYKGGIYEDK